MISLQYRIYLQVNLARLSQKTIERVINEPITVPSKSASQAHHSRSNGRQHDNSESRKPRSDSSSKRQESTKSTATKSDSSKLTSKKHEDKSDVTKSGSENEKNHNENKPIARSTSVAAKKKAAEPLDKMATVSPPKVAKRAESNPRRPEHENKVDDSLPKPSPRKTRLRSRAESEAPKMTANATAVFASKNINTDSETAKPAKRTRLRLKLPQMDGANDIRPSRKRAKPKPKPSESSDEEASSGSDFEPEPPKRNRSKVNLNRSKSRSKTNLNKSLVNRRKSIDTRVFSTDDDDEVEENTNRMDFWVEAYAEKEKKWIAIDPVKRKVDAAEFVRVRIFECYC